MFYKGILPLIIGEEFNDIIQHSSYHSIQHIVCNINSPGLGPEPTTTWVALLNIDFYIGKAEVNKPYSYNFEIGIQMLARYSYRCRLISIGCSSDIRAMQSHCREDVDQSVSYIQFLHGQRQVKYVILMSL